MDRTRLDIGSQVGRLDVLDKDADDDVRVRLIEFMAQLGRRSSCHLTVSSLRRRSQSPFRLHARLPVVVLRCRLRRFRSRLLVAFVQLGLLEQPVQVSLVLPVSALKPDEKSASDAY
jgi:hypothetical protein